MLSVFHSDISAVTAQEVARENTNSLGLDSRSVHVGFVVDKMEVQRGFLGVLWYFCVSIIPPVPPNHTGFIHYRRSIS